MPGKKHPNLDLGVSPGVRISAGRSPFSPGRIEIVAVGVESFGPGTVKRMMRAGVDDDLDWKACRAGRLRQLPAGCRRRPIVEFARKDQRGSKGLEDPARLRVGGGIDDADASPCPLEDPLP